MTNRPRARSVAFFSFLVLAGPLVTATAALAADQLVPLPERLHVAPEIFAASIENLAVPLQTAEGAAASRVLQVRGAQALSTDLPGAVTSLVYSFDGRFLLVQSMAATSATTAEETTDAAHRVPIARGPAARAMVESDAPLADPQAAPATEHQVSLIGADGAILWTKADDRRFEFSTTGEVIVASSEEPGTGLRSNVEVFDLKGKPLRTLPVSSYSADAALVLAEGRKALLVVERSLLCVDFAQDGTILWRHDLSRSEPDFARLFSLAPDKIVLQLAEGRFKLFQPSGTLTYDYDPATVALAYPELTEAEARQLSPEAGPNGCSITVFSGGPNARQIHLGTSRIFKKYVSLDAPGYKRIGSVIAGKLLFVSPANLLIRSLRDEFKAPSGDVEP